MCLSKLVVYSNTIPSLRYQPSHEWNCPTVCGLSWCSPGACPACFACPVYFRGVFACPRPMGVTGYWRWAGGLPAPLLPPRPGPPVLGSTCGETTGASQVQANGAGQVQVHLAAPFVPRTPATRRCETAGTGGPPVLAPQVQANGAGQA